MWLATGLAARLRPLPVIPAATRLRPWPLPVWPPRVLRATLACALAGLVAFAGWVTAVETWGRERARAYLAFDAASRGAVVRDRTGRVMGVVPAGVGRPPPGFVPRTVVPVRRVPGVWLAVLVALEDRHVGTVRHVYGIDVAALAAVPLSLLGGRRRGASTLAMQLARSMRAMPPDADDGLPGLLARKAMELLDGPALWRVGGGIGGELFEHLLADHLPLAIGSRGSPLGGTIYGLGLASLTLFGVPADELDPARQALLAAAVRRPVLVAARGDARGIRLARERWAYLRRRAAYGVRLAFPEGPERARLLRELETLAPPPVVDGRLPARLFPDRVHPVLRARSLLGAAAGTVATLPARDGEVRLTLDGAVQERLIGAFRRERARLRARFPEWDLRRPHLLVAVTGSDGGLLALATDSEEPLVLGRVHGADGGLRPWGARTGSVTKIAAALALAAEDGPDARWCARAFGDPPVHDPDGSTGHPDCRSPAAWASARETFARSLNLPLLHRLARLDRDRLAAAAAFLGLHLPDDVPPHVAIATGHASAAPLDVAAALAALHRHLVTGRPAPSCPRLPADDRSRCRAGDVLTRLLPDAAARARLRALLRAPFAPHGTLHALAGFARRHPDAVAKSGTDRVDGRLLARWIAGAFAQGGESYGFVVLAVAADATRPLPEGFSHAHLAPFVRALEAAVAAPRSGRPATTGRDAARN